MTTRTFHFVILTDEQGIRVRCVFCGGVLFDKQDRIERPDLAEFLEAIKDHPCFGSAPPLPRARIPRL